MKIVYTAPAMSFVAAQEWVASTEQKLEEWQTLKVEVTPSGFLVSGDFSDMNEDSTFTIEHDGGVWTVTSSDEETVGTFGIIDARESKILRVDGLFGSFEGEYAKSYYEDCVAFARQLFGKVYDACEMTGVFRHNGWCHTYFIRTAWAMLKDKDLCEEVDAVALNQAMNSQILKNMLQKINEGLYNQSVTGTGNERLSMRQFTSLVVFLREHHQMGQSQSWRPINI